MVKKIFLGDHRQMLHKGYFFHLEDNSSRLVPCVILGDEICKREKWETVGMRWKTLLNKLSYMQYCNFYIFWTRCAQGLCISQMQNTGPFNLLINLFYLDSGVIYTEEKMNFS